MCVPFTRCSDCLSAPHCQQQGFSKPLMFWKAYLNCCQINYDCIFMFENEKLIQQHTTLHKYYRKAARKLIFHFLAPHQLQLEAAASPCSQCRSPKASHLADFGRCGLWCRLCWCRGRLRRRLRWMRRLRLRLGLQPVGGDLVNLPWGCHVHHVVGLHLNLVARWQEGVETHDQVWVALEELRYTADHPWSVDAGEGIRWQCHHPLGPFSGTSFSTQQSSIRFFSLITSSLWNNVL